MKIKNNFFEKFFFEKILLSLIVFLTPTQLAIHFWPSFSLIFGIRIDYLAPAIYLTDILVLTLLTNWVLRDRQYIGQQIKKYKNYLILFLVFTLLNSFFSTTLLPTLIKWLKVLELGAFSFYVSRNYKTVGEDLIFKTLYCSLILVSVVGITQFLLGRTIGGPLYFLGERSFSLQTPGIALAQINGHDYLRAYSVFAHPNSLAGYLCVGLLMLFNLDFLRRKKFNLIGLLLIITCLFLTFSLSAFLGMVFCLAIYTFFIHKHFLKKVSVGSIFLIVLGSIMMPLISKLLILSNFSFHSNISERLGLAVVSGKMISEKFFFGQGLNTFILNIQRFSSGVSYSWLLQPVHNIFLLAFSEVGIVGLLLVCLLFYKGLIVSIRNNQFNFVLVFLFVATAGFFDHYWFTLQQNLLLLALLFGIVYKKDK